MKYYLMAFVMVSMVLGIIGCSEDNLINDSILLQGDDIANASDARGNIDLKLNADIQDTLIPLKKYYLEEGKEMSGRVYGFDFILEVLTVSKKKGIAVKVNNKKFTDLRVGQYVELDDNLVLNVEDALFNDPNEKRKSLVFFSFENRTIEHYSDYLIEEDIDDIYYIESYKQLRNASFSNNVIDLVQYKAVYEDIVVNVLVSDNDYLRNYFSLRYPDRSNLKEVFFNKYIILQEGSSFASWISKGAVVEINVNRSLDFDDVESVIKAYLQEYPTVLTEDYNCVDRIILEEKATVRIKTDKEYEVLNYAVSDSSGDVKLKVDDEFIDVLEVGDYFVLGETPVTIDNVEIFEDGDADYVEFCVG